MFHAAQTNELPALDCKKQENFASFTAILSRSAALSFLCACSLENTNMFGESFAVSTVTNYLNTCALYYNHFDTIAHACFTMKIMVMSRGIGGASVDGGHGCINCLILL